MSKRNANNQPLKAVISDFLKISGLEDKFDEAEVMKHWIKIMGPAIAKKTLSLRLRKNTLTVRLDSGVLKEEFSYAKEKIAQLLNESIGKAIIQKVEIY